MQYRFKDAKYRSKDFDQQKAGEALEKLRKQNGNSLTPEAVIEEAKKPRSPIHKEFPWDLKVAAYQHWLYIARKLIASVEIVRRGNHNRQVKVRAFVKIGKKASPYESTVEVLNDADKREILVQQALDEAEQWNERYNDLNELALIHGAIKKTVASKRRKPSSRGVTT
jgi:hypothetical protein